MSDSSDANRTPTLFTNVPVNLFRMGNASGPRLDNIRDRDVPLVDVVLPSGDLVKMVAPDGGLSTFDAINPRLMGKWWCIPAGTELPETIRVVRDQTDPRSGITHFSLRPARMMTLLEFAEGLRQLAWHAKPVWVAAADEVGKRGVGNE